MALSESEWERLDREGRGGKRRRGEERGGADKLQTLPGRAD